MKQHRQAPLFTIDGTTFLVDIDGQLLRQVNDSRNEISFISQMTDLGNYYGLLYNPAHKNAARNTDDDTGLLDIKVPRLADLDPVGMSEKYGIPIGQLQGKTDFEIIVDQQALERRHQGDLPRIELAGESFIIDLRLQELRHALNFHPVISLKSFDLSNDGWHYDGYYHTTLKQLVPIDPKLTEFPDNVVKLRIPNELGLDPVATARTYNMDERELLRRFPIQTSLKAEVIPLSETDIPALIRRNRQELRDEHAQIARQIRPKRRPGL